MSREESSMSEIQEIVSHEEEGSYLVDILLDNKLVTKIKNNGHLDLESNEGINQKILEKINRKNIIYNGIMCGEQSVPIEQATAKFQAPVVKISQVQERLKKIKETDRKKIGFIHVNVVQIVIRSTFREGITTPVIIRVEDNRIQDKRYSLLGQIEGDLGYGVIKFNVTLQYPIPLITRSFNNCIGVICEFRKQDLMKQGDIPLVVCYRIAYALTNSAISLQYKHLDRLYTNKIFSETSTIIRTDQVQKNFLREHSQRFPSLQIGESSSQNRLIPTESGSQLAPPTRKDNLYKEDREDQIEKIRKQVNELSTVVTSLDKRI
ncbi:putative cell-to-cell transport protein [Peanut chlorotic streak virus]|uniref:Putative cell-to-cell transport protein n=1 Tax=Peanut chlorotic streak virus TaxID=35593 RepID=Q84684_9VIRU|nr:hypothetical protein [Peanut chlorotic streak virus]AAA50242.1 putative cell-to-cell transport protein [Peanut chlorotic streak virus]